MLKNEAIDDLVQAIQAVLSGERFISPAVQSLGALDASRDARLKTGALSKREITVLRLLAEGQRNSEIAETLGISVKTVETYRSRIMLKLEIDNLASLVKLAIRSGITSAQT